MRQGDRGLGDVGVAGLGVGDGGGQGRVAGALGGALELERQLRLEAEGVAAADLEALERGGDVAEGRDGGPSTAIGSQLVGLRVKFGRSMLSAIERTSSGMPARIVGIGSLTAWIWAVSGST